MSNETPMSPMAPPPPPASGVVPPPPAGATAAVPPPRLAGFGLRLGGEVIDSIVYGLVALLAAIPGVILIILGLDDCDQSNNEITCDLQGSDAGLIAGGVGLILVGVLAVMLWYVRSLGKTGQTIGRKAVGIKVVRSATQQPLGFGAALGRTLFAGVFSSAIFYLGYLWMLWDDKNQTWHDKVVDSIVITT